VDIFNFSIAKSEEYFILKSIGNKRYWKYC